MKLLIKSAIIIDSANPLHRKKRDILIESGYISKIGVNLKINANIKVLSLPNLHVSIGWFDSSVSFGDPGYEERETLENGLNTAAKSGFTAVAINPNTAPVADNKASIAYLLHKSESFATQVYPIGSFTLDATGKDMAELYDMQKAGAVAFNDYKVATQNPNLLKTALRYAQAFDGLIMSYPQEDSIANKGFVNESAYTVGLGLKGNPNLAEALQVSRDIYLLAYAGGRVHIPTISTAESVRLIRQAQKKGLQISCSVSAHHLCLTDQELEDFDANFKVQPPLRTQKDCNALIKGVKEGTIAMITSDHQPIDIDNKKKEFAQAKSGTIGLESLFGAINNQLDLDDFIKSLTHKPRHIFGIDVPEIKEGALANLTFFNPEYRYTFSKNHILSTSKNSAFIGKELKGEAYGIFNKNQLILK